MSDKRRGGQAWMDPMKFWRQWYKAGTKMWANTLNGRQANYMDPYGLYRQWFNGLGNLQKQMFRPVISSTAARDRSATPAVNPTGAAINPAAINPAEANPPAVEAQNLWKQGFEAAQESWQQAAGLGTEAVNLTPRWVTMLDQIRHNFLVAEGFPTDPLQLATRWYNATSGPLTDFVGDLVEREKILDFSSRLMHHYATFYKVFRRDSEEYLKAVSVPARSDITRVAELVVALEDKIDQVEEAFENFEDSYAQPSPADSVGALERRIDDVEAKIDQLLVAFENTSQEDSGAQASSPQQEEDTQEERAPQANGSEGSEVRATAAARRKAEELGVDLTQVEGTGVNGQITVGDVRKAQG